MVSDQDLPVGRPGPGRRAARSSITGATGIGQQPHRGQRQAGRGRGGGRRPGPADPLPRPTPSPTCWKPISPTACPTRTTTTTSCWSPSTARRKQERRSDRRGLLTRRASDDLEHLRGLRGPGRDRPTTTDVRGRRELATPTTPSADPDRGAMRGRGEGIAHLGRAHLHRHRSQGEELQGVLGRGDPPHPHHRHPGLRGRSRPPWPGRWAGSPARNSRRSGGAERAGPWPDPRPDPRPC